MNQSRIPIVILHGWGLNTSVYKPLTHILEKKGYQVYSFDLPGFGKEPLSSPNMKLDDYVEFVRSFLKQRKATKSIIIGHSFGGRIAIKLAYKYPAEVEKLILTGVPIIRNKSFFKIIQFLSAKIGGRVLKLFPVQYQSVMRWGFYKMIGEWDYYKAGSLAQVFKNVVSEELTGYVKNLRVPTALVWGEKDQRVPASDIIKIKTLIKNSQVIIIPKVGHTPMRDNPSQYFESIKSFL